MSFSFLLASLTRSILIQQITTYTAGLVLGLGALGVIIEKAGPGSQAIVHVVEPNVEVRIGDEVVWVETHQFSPIVFDLLPGRHELVVSRDDRVLYRETFDVRPGASQVLNAMAPQSEPATPTPPIALLVAQEHPGRCLETSRNRHQVTESCRYPSSQ